MTREDVDFAIPPTRSHGRRWCSSARAVYAVLVGCGRSNKPNQAIDHRGHAIFAGVPCDGAALARVRTGVPADGHEASLSGVRRIARSMPARARWRRVDPRTARRPCHTPNKPTMQLARLPGAIAPCGPRARGAERAVAGWRGRADRVSGRTAAGCRRAGPRSSADRHAPGSPGRRPTASGDAQRAADDRGHARARPRLGSGRSQRSRRPSVGCAAGRAESSRGRCFSRRTRGRALRSRLARRETARRRGGRRPAPGPRATW